MHCNAIYNSCNVIGHRNTALLKSQEITVVVWFTVT